MLRNLRQKLLTAATVLVFVAGFAPAGVFAQNTVSAVIDVGPGERRCLTNPTRAVYNASVYDYVISGDPVKFVFLGRPESSTDFVEISNSGTYPVWSFSDYEEDPGFTGKPVIPRFFPGFFRTCARNNGTQPSTVSLSLTVN